MHSFVAYIFSFKNYILKFMHMKSLVYSFSLLHNLLVMLLLLLKSLQSCLTLCDPIDGSPLGSPVPGILQARILEWVAISFSDAWKWKVKVKSLNCVRLFATPWTAAYLAPPSMGFPRQEYWSGVPLPSPLSYEYTTIYFFYLCDEQVFIVLLSVFGSRL